MTKPIDIAKAMLIEGNNDYEVVPILIESGKYNLAVYHAQQAVEKLLKACLASEGKIGNAVIPLEESWANSRYPDWSIEPIWIPSQQYTLDNAIQI
jgi:HEPN domain-containing protein